MKAYKNNSKLLLGWSAELAQINLSDIVVKQMMLYSHRAILIVIMIAWQYPAHADNTPPSASPFPDKFSARVGEVITFTSGAFDWEGDALTKGWNFGDGCGYTSVYDDIMGKYRMEDGLGFWSKVNTGEYDFDNDTWIYEWQFTLFLSSSPCGSLEDPASHVFEHNSDVLKYSIEAAATDGQYLSKGFTSVTIYGMPVAKITGSYAAKEGQTLVFDGTKSYDPKNETLSYQWDFGDGTTGTGVSPSHVYAKLGQYSASLNVCAGSFCSPIVTTSVSIESNPAWLMPIINLILE